MVLRWRCVVVLMMVALMRVEMKEEKRCPEVCPSSCPDDKLANCKEHTVIDECGCCPVCVHYKAGVVCGPAAACAPPLLCATRNDTATPKCIQQASMEGCADVECLVPFHPRCPDDARLVIRPPEKKNDCCGRRGECVCNEEWCSIPSCSSGLERVLVREGDGVPGRCCDKYECGKKEAHCLTSHCPPSVLHENEGEEECPADSYRPPSHRVEGACCPIQPGCRCRASICKPATCPEGKTVKVTKRGSGTPGRCCDEWTCVEETTTLMKECLRAGVKYKDGEEWHENACDTCRCLHGLSRDDRGCFVCMADIGTIVERLFRETGLAGLPFYVGGAAVVEEIRNRSYSSLGAPVYVDLPLMQPFVNQILIIDPTVDIIPCPPGEPDTFLFKIAIGICTLKTAALPVPRNIMTSSTDVVAPSSPQIDPDSESGEGGETFQGNLSDSDYMIVIVDIGITRFYCGITEEERKGECSVSLWTNQIFQIMEVILGVGGMYATDHWGIRVSTLIGAMCNFMGAAIRLSSSLPDTPIEYRSIILHIGNIISASAPPFFLVLAPKVAEKWFPSGERATAHVCIFIANPLGVALGTVVPTLIIDQSKVTASSFDFFVLNAVVLSLATVVLLIAPNTKNSLPPTPATASPSITDHLPFFIGLLMTLKNNQLLIQLIPFGLQWGFFLYTDHLCTELGYPESVTAWASASSSVIGSIAAFIAGRYVGRTKEFKETIRWCILFFALTAAATDRLLRYPVTPSTSRFFTSSLIFLSSLLGAASSPIYPIGIELAMETTFPVMEATSGGGIATGGRIIMFSLVLIVDRIRFTRWIYSDYDSPTAIPKLTSNYFLLLDSWVIFAFFAAFVALKLMNPRYARIEYEESVNLQKRLERGSTPPTTKV